MSSFSPDSADTLVAHEPWKEESCFLGVQVDAQGFTVSELFLPACPHPAAQPSRLLVLIGVSVLGCLTQDWGTPHCQQKGISPAAKRLLVPAVERQTQSFMQCCVQHA